jgi:NAD(P)-dependent dehydrogenase (short-subunit alcohol dehydrogenase family)
MAMLTGKSVVITGAGRGIGAACARGVARQGAAVVVNDIDAAEADATVEAIRAEGGTAIAWIADITEWDEAGRLIRSCIDGFGRIDGLVNNAGLFVREPIDQLDPATARRLVEANILGSLHCAAQAVDPMLAQGAGSIVNVTSETHLGSPPYGVYGATKGAVASMVYTWALELAGTGVRVNALSPHGATRMVLASFDDDEEARRVQAGFPSPATNSPVVEYLLSDAAREVNGQLAFVCGNEINLYTHPALLVPPAVREHWTAEAMADAFDHEFRDKLIPCGTVGMETLPIALQSGHWKRAGEAAERT